MYLQFFGLTEAPFSITPDPAFVYLSAAHRDALAHLLYGVGKGGAGGFVQLTGEVGTGKTTMCRCLLEQVPEDTIIALILNPMLTPRELLGTICEELNIDVRDKADSSKALVDALNACLLDHHSHGRRVVVVIDEAQNLSPESLEQVRLLTNLETAKHKLLQMVLLGQPELRQLLQRQNLRQLAQRITARYHLAPLAEKETFAYVRHRMQVAGAQVNPFTRSALRALHQRSGGVPRLINIIADRALDGAYAREVRSVDGRLVQVAANEVQPSETRMRRNPWPGLIAATSALILALISVYMWGWPELSRRASPVVVSNAQPNAEEVKESISASTQHSSSAVAERSDDQSPASIVQDSELPSVGPPVAENVASDMNTADVRAEIHSLAPVAETVVSLDSSWLDTQHGLSWWGLASLWQDSNAARSIQAACDGQHRTGYECLRDQGSWARVKRLGLPVILVLNDRGGRQVLLQGLDERRLLLGAGDARIVVDREEIEPLWLGEYIVAWPQDPDWPREIKKGESGNAVDIVMQMAGQADPAWTGGSVFDASFEFWLIAFQRQHGLTPDGIIGPMTLLYLMAPAITEPRLAVIVEERS